MSRGMTGRATKGAEKMTHDDIKARQREYAKKRRAGELVSQDTLNSMYTKKQVQNMIGVTSYMMGRVVSTPRAKMPEPSPIQYRKRTYWNKQEINEWLPYIKELLGYDDLRPLKPIRQDIFFNWLKQYKPEPHHIAYRKFLERNKHGNN